ncbi:MAG: hypothetical protein DMD90_07020 [Candidatus Rokuibacteriota bacterium]|nr:MAG: hypothetical protein DMD90_07020 [Candidatus Rokubacteria bacterium]
MGSAHSKRRPVSKCVHWRHAWIGTRQFGHCSSDAVAIGRTAPHAPHRETVCLASIPPPRGASDGGGGGGGDGRFGSPPWFRYPCCRYFRSDMLVVPFGPLLYPMPVAGAPVGREACPNGRTGARLRPAIREFREDSMKLVLFQKPAASDVVPGVLTERGVVSIADVVPSRHTPQLTMQGIIDAFDALRPALERCARDGDAMPLSAVRLRAPLPRPGKILACIANYWEHGAMEPRALNMFLKNPDAVIGPGDTIALPEHTEPWIFMHEAELALVIKGPAKMVKRDNWRSAVFGYTGMIDVSARGEGRRTWKTGSWLGKSFDTFAPIGPCIATIDEIADPNDVHVQFWVDGQLRHNYNTDDMEHLVPELVEFATTIMTLNSGDVIACGTNHEGLGPLQDGEVVDFEIHGVGRMRLHVRDPLKRTWEKGIYMGADSTNPEAVKRNRPKAAS